MKKFTIVLISILLLVGALACEGAPTVPDVNVPTLEVGEMQEKQHSVPLAGAGPTDVEVIFGTGKLSVEAGASNELFFGDFNYNVERWAPQITYRNDELTIRQGGKEENWGVPTGVIRNRWNLDFSPAVPMAMVFKLGAGDGELDFSGLQMTAIDVRVGAGDYILRFDEPNRAMMEHFKVNAGASKLEILQIGNANPEQMNLRGGVGDMGLDFTGAWTRSSEMDIIAGAGSLTLRLPDNIGVQVKTQGPLSKIEAPDMTQVDNSYINDMFGETSTELQIQITTGLGSVRLIEVPN
jgi:hypothetical protein